MSAAHIQTPAQRQAVFLTALAGHLDEHPHLVPAWIQSDNSDNTVYVPGCPLAGLVAWFASVGATGLRVDLEDEYAAVHAYRVTIGGQSAREVWGTVQGLQRLLVQGGGYGQLHLTLGELAHFAEHATLPGRSEPR